MESTHSIQIKLGFGVLANENLILSHVFTESFAAAGHCNLVVLDRDVM